MINADLKKNKKKKKRANTLLQTSCHRISLPNRNNRQNRLSSSEKSHSHTSIKSLETHAHHLRPHADMQTPAQGQIWGSNWSETHSTRHVKPEWVLRDRKFGFCVISCSLYPHAGNSDRAAMQSDDAASDFTLLRIDRRCLTGGRLSNSRPQRVERLQHL